MVCLLLDWTDPSSPAGPFLPGYGFYQLLLQSKNLEVPIPDTIVVEGGSVTHLFNGRHGTIEKAEPNYETTEAWVSSLMSRFLSPTCANPYAKAEPPEPLSVRTVGIVKKQLWKTHVMNHTETLSAIGVQAYLTQCLKAGNSDRFVLQKFIKCRGRRPCFNRIFWRAGTDTVSSNRTIVGWNITSNSDFAKNPHQFQGRPSASGSGSRKKRSESVDTAAAAAFDDSDRRNVLYLPESDEWVPSALLSLPARGDPQLISRRKFLSWLRTMSDLNSAESASIKMRDSQVRSRCALCLRADRTIGPSATETSAA
jgi:hypothetical protein